MPGGFVCSGRLKASLRTGKVKEAVAGERPIRSLFTKQQRAFLAEHAPRASGSRTWLSSARSPCSS